MKHSNDDMQNVLFANFAVFLVHTKTEFLRLVSGTSAHGEWKHILYLPSGKSMNQNNQNNPSHIILMQ